MTLTVNLPADLAERLATEATRRGVKAEGLAAEFIAEHLSDEVPADSLDAFVGSGDSGDASWASRDTHDLRTEAAARHAGEA